MVYVDRIAYHFRATPKFTLRKTPCYRHEKPQDVQEDLKLSLDSRIERALSEQAWQALARELLRNNRLHVRSVKLLIAFFSFS